MQLERRGVLGDFVQGLLSVPAGIGFLARTEGALRTALAPAAIGVGVWAALTAVATWAIVGALHAVLPSHGTFGVLGRTFLALAAIALAALLAGLVALAIAQPLARAALEHLSSRLSRSLGAAEPAMRSSHVLASLATALGAIGFVVPGIGLVELLTAAFPEAAVVTEALVPVVTALAVAWDMLDHPMSRRGMTWGARLRWIWRNAALVLGFAFATQILLLVPVLDLLALPIGVLGATRLLVVRPPDDEPRTLT